MKRAFILRDHKFDVVTDDKSSQDYDCISRIPGSAVQKDQRNSHAVIKFFLYSTLLLRTNAERRSILTWKELRLELSFVPVFYGDILILLLF